MGTSPTFTRPRLASLALAAALVAAFLVFPSETAHAASPTLLTSENFNTATVSDPNWKTGGTSFAACLTASTNTTQTPIPGCASGAVSLPAGGDPTSSGTLRLTENVGNQVGYALYDVPLPFTKGLQITFDQYQYNGSGADGIGFFLADGSASTFTQGQPGGSFGYAQRSGLVGTPSGYLGLAVDAYGNFANDNENRGTNCTVAEGKSPYSGTKPNTVTLRGPGSGLNKYCWLATSATLSPALRTNGTVRTAANTKQGMRITIDPSTNTVKVERNMYDGNGYATVLSTAMPPSPPSTVKFGFLASTGGSNDIHEVDNVSITTLEQLAALQTTIAPATPSYVSGTTGTLNIGVSSLASEGAGNSAVKVKSTLPTGVSLSGTPTGTNWDCSASSGQNVSCTRTGAVFYTAGTVFEPISVPVTYASTYSGNLTLTDTAYAADAAPDYGTGSVNVTPLAVADSTTAVGGAATAMTVLSNDKGKLDPTSVTITSPSANGTTSVNATTGVVTFTSSPGFSGVTTYTYSVKDTTGQSTSAVATVTVTPKAYNDAVATPVNTAVTHNPLANDFGNFTAGSLTITSSPTHGTAAVQPGDLIKYTPTANYSGTDTLTYRITDGATNVTATVTYTIAPTLTADTATTSVNTATTISVLSNDLGSLTNGSVAVGTAPAHGTAAKVGSTGTIKYTPTTDWSGTDTFTYTASDGTTTGTGTVTVTVTPTAAADTASTTANTAVTTNVLANDHGSLPPASVTVTTAPVNGTTSVNASTGAITYTPTSGWSGVDTYKYTATDGAGQPVTATVTVTVSPTAAADTLTRSITTPGAITFTPLSNDVGSLNASSFAFNGATVFTTSSWDAATKTLTVTQPGGATASGTWTQGYKICDTTGTCATSTFTLTVTPLAVADSGTTAYLTPIGTTVLANDAGSLTKASLAVTSGPAHGSTSVNTTTGVITYTPAANWSGVDTYTYSASDGTTTSSAVVTITTTPKANADTATTTGQTPVDVPVLTNDKGVLVPATVSVSVAPTVGSAVPHADGTITYTAPAHWSGTQTFTYGVNDAASSTATATVTITVKPDAKADSATTTAGTAVAVGVLDNDDATPNPATETVVGFAHGTATVNPTTGVVTYTPAANWSGDDTATVSYKDTSNQNASSTLTITTTPVANADTATTAAQTAVTVPVLGNDKGTFVASSVAVPASGAGSPAHGTTTVNPTTGAVTYTPGAGFSGADTFTYSAKDAANRTATATVTVTVTPTPVDDAATTDSRTPVDVSVLANDKGSIDASTLTAPATSVHGGTVTVVGDKLRYTPLHTFSGSDSVTYTVSDTSGQPSTATVTFTVTPVATDDVAASTASAPDTTTAVLANDDGSLVPGSVVVTVAPVHGTATVNPATGAITVHPTAGWSGKDVLTYKVCDTSAQCTTAKLRTTVTPVSAPTSPTTPVNTPIVLHPTTGQTGDFDLTTVSVTAPPVSGTVTVDGLTGDLTYTPATDFSGTDAFTFTIEDKDGQPITVAATVQVTPISTNDSVTTPVDVPVDIDVLANDHGTFTAVDAPWLNLSSGATPHGYVTVNPDRTLHYVPNAGFSGTDSIYYVAHDPAGHTTAAIVTVVVSAVAVDDDATSNGHAPVTVDVLANDHGNLLPASVTVPSTGPDAPAHGTATVDTGDGSITYTPAANWSGTDTFTYTACDANGCTTATVTVVTTPDAADDTASTVANDPVTTGVQGNDHGDFPAGSTTVTTAPSHGTTTVDPLTGAVTYTPTNDWSGSDSYGYTVTDNEGRTATAVVHVTVTPTLTDDVAILPANAPTGVDVLADDHGALDPSTVTVLTGPAHGTTSVDPSTGVVTYTPAAGWTGDDTFTYRACDAAAQCGTATVTLHVKPVAGDDSATTTANHNTTVDVLANDHGSLDPATVQVTSGPADGSVSVDGATGAITYSPDHNWSGDDVLTYEVCDAGGSCDSATVGIHVAPTAFDDTDTSTANTAATTNVLGNDHGTLQPGSVTVTTPPAHGSTTVDGSTGAVTYTPDTDWSGVDTYAYGVSDAAGSVATAHVSVTVTPVATDDARSTSANQAVGVDATTNDHGTLVAASVAVSSAPSHGTTSVDPSTGVITYTPAHDWSGDDGFDYGVCDATPSCTSAHVDVHVTPVADDDSATTTSNHGVTVDVVANDHGTIDATTVAVGVPAAHGTTGVDPSTGAITYTPDHDWSGPDSFGYQEDDAAGRTTTATVTIAVGIVLDDDSATTTANNATSVDVLANDHGALDPASVTVTTAPLHGTTTVEADGSITYTPAANWSGDDAFAYRACDAVPTCATASVGVVVTPTTADDHATTTPGDAVTADVLANDHGTLVGSTLAVVTDGAHGTTTIDASHRLVYTPDVSWSGTDHVAYAVTDAAGRTVGATLTVDVGVVAHDDSATTPVATPTTVDVLANDHGAPVPSSVTATAGPNHGTATVDPSTGEITYTPDAHWSGTDVLTYRACDASASCAEADVHVVVTPVADVDGTNTDTDAGQPVVVDVLANDEGALDPSSVTVISAPGHGTTTVDPSTGRITYTPADDWSGNDTLTYRVCDSTPSCATALVHVHVLPTSTDDSVTTTSEHPLVIDVTGNDHGTLDPSTVAVVSAPSHGTAVANPSNGRITYTPPNGWSGTDTFTYTVCDAVGSCTQSAVTVHVAPTAADDSASIDTGTSQTSVTVDTLANDSGSFGPGAVTISGGPAHGTATVDDDGVVTYTPNPGYLGTDTVEYTACDENNECVDAVVHVTVKGLTVVAGSRCERTAPYVDYAITPVAFTPAVGAKATLSWIKADGSVAGTLTGQPLHGTLLWPGATVDASHSAITWPGWTQRGDGTWERVDDGLEPNLTLRVSMGPATDVSVTYPRATKQCAAAPRTGGDGNDSDAPAPRGGHPADDAAPTGTAPNSLAATGSDLAGAVQLAISMLFMGIVLAIAARRRGTPTAGRR